MKTKMIYHNNPIMIFALLSELVQVCQRVVVTCHNRLFPRITRSLSPFGLSRGPKITILDAGHTPCIVYGYTCFSLYV